MAIKPKGKAPTVSRLKKKADQAFSEFIRRNAADENGMVRCVTCNVVKPWQQQQAGHYEKRGVNPLRYDERNCHPQCVGCNVFQNGNYPKYAIFMVETYGQSILQQLRSEAQVTKQWKAWELTELIDHYKAKLQELT